MKKLIFIISFFGCLSLSAQTYITTAGNNSNSGLDEANAKAITHLSSLSTGEDVYLKAGDYGAVQLTISASGTSLNPIEIIGYKNTPGDIVAFQGTTLPDQSLPDVTEAPTISGTTTTNRPDQNNGILVTGDYITIKNFQAFSYNLPLQMNGDFAIVDNYASYRAGNHNPPDLSGFSANFPDGAYTGFGIVFRSDNHKLTNSFVRDSGAEGFKVLNSNGGEHEYNFAKTVLGVGPLFNFPASNGNPTDYHYFVGGNASNITIKNCKVEQINGMSSPGHGFVVKTLNSGTPTDNILFEDCLVINSKMETQFPNATNIVFKNSEVRSTDDQFRREEHEVNIANGGDGVRVEGIRFTGGSSLKIRGWVDTYGSTYPYSATNAKILNCAFEGVGTGRAIWITHGPGNNDTHKSMNITFDHNTFDNWAVLAYTSSDFEGYEFKNNLVSNIPSYDIIGFHDGTGPQGGTGGPYPFFADWDNNNFFNSFTPNGANDTNTNVTSLDPQLDSQYRTTNSSLLTSGIGTSDFASGLPLGYLGQISSQTPVNNNKSSPFFGFGIN